MLSYTSRPKSPKLILVQSDLDLQVLTYLPVPTRSRAAVTSASGCVDRQKGSENVCQCAEPTTRKRLLVCVIWDGSAGERVDWDRIARPCPRIFLRPRSSPDGSLIASQGGGVNCGVMIGESYYIVYIAAFGYQISL